MTLGKHQLSLEIALSSNPMQKQEILWSSTYLLGLLLCWYSLMLHTLTKRFPPSQIGHYRYAGSETSITYEQVRTAKAEPNNLPQPQVSKVQVICNSNQLLWQSWNFSFYMVFSVEGPRSSICNTETADFVYWNSSALRVNPQDISLFWIQWRKRLTQLNASPRVNSRSNQHRGTEASSVCCCNAGNQSVSSTHEGMDICETKQTVCCT